MAQNYSTLPELEVNKVWSIDSSNQIDKEEFIIDDVSAKSITKYRTKLINSAVSIFNK